MMTKSAQAKLTAMKIQTVGGCSVTLAAHRHRRLGRELTILTGVLHPSSNEDSFQQEADA